jgi:hypothetical protein
MPANNRFRLPSVMPPASFRPTVPLSGKANNIGVIIVKSSLYQSAYFRGINRPGPAIIS